MCVCGLLFEFSERNKRSHYLVCGPTQWRDESFSDQHKKNRKMVITTDNAVHQIAWNYIFILYSKIQILPLLNYEEIITWSLKENCLKSADMIQNLW